MHVIPNQSKVTEDEAYTNLAKCILLQAITDYVSLVEIGAINKGVVNDEFWMQKTAKTKPRKLYRKKPIGIESAQCARDLITFFESKQLEMLCQFVNHKACRIRKRIGIKDGETPSLTTEQMNWICTPSKECRERIAAKEQGTRK